MSCICDGLQIIVDRDRHKCGATGGPLEWGRGGTGTGRVDRLRRKCRTRILNGELLESGWKCAAQSRQLAARPALELAASLWLVRHMPLLRPPTETATATTTTTRPLDHYYHDHRDYDHHDHHGHHHLWKAFSSLCRLYSFPSLVRMTMAFAHTRAGDILVTLGGPQDTIGVS
jgi:hypothetical protein